MNLRRKAIAIVAGTMIVLCLFLGSILSALTLDGYRHVERKETTDEVERALKGLAADVQRISSIAGDWAPWDDTYDYMLGRNPKYEADNLSLDSLANLRINMMAIVDAKGRVVLLRLFDLRSRQFLTPPSGFDVLAPDDLLLRHADIRSGAEGIWESGRMGPMLVSSRPITTSDFAARPVGSLIVGLFLDAREAAELSDRLSLDIAFAKDEDSGGSREISEVGGRGNARASLFVKVEGRDKVVGYSTLRDIEGRPAGYLEVSLPRRLYREGLYGLSFVFIALAIMAVVSSLAVTLIVDRLILGRLSLLGRELERVGKTGDRDARVELGGNDEFTTLATIANSGLSRLGEANRTLRASLEEKSLLLQEIQHRVKNNLQIVSSLLSLQSGMLKDSEARDALRESENRISSMALIHEFLYRQEDSGKVDLAHVEFLEYLRQLADHLVSSYRMDRRRIVVVVEGDDVRLDADTAIYCGLVMNELISNALKHAFPDGRTGRIELGLRGDGLGTLTLAVSDDGIGLQSGFDGMRREGMGLQLVRALADQIGGTIEIGGRKGCEVKLRFALPSWDLPAPG